MVKVQKTAPKVPASGSRTQASKKKAVAWVCVCGVCKEEISEDTKALQCEKCGSDNAWRCIECLGISVDTYDNLASTSSHIRWFCEACDKKLLSTSDQQQQSKASDQNMSEIKAMFEALLEKTRSIEDTLKNKAEAKTVSELEIRITKLEEVVANREQIKDGPEMPKKQLEEVVQKVVSRHLGDEQDLKNRKRNCIIYRVPEDATLTQDTRVRMENDRKFVSSLCGESLQVDLKEGEVLKMFRLGKKLEADKPRPLLVGFVSEEKKLEVMKSLHKLKNAKAEHKIISVSHDLTPFQRDEVRQALREARQQPNSAKDQQAENMKYKVVGLGSKIRVVCMEKQ
jgi:hypothetical protein